MAGKKSIDELKSERTTAKRSFSRLVNHITRSHLDMSSEELMEQFKKLTQESSQVLEINEELEEAYIAADKKGELNDDQRADIWKTVKDCEEKLKDGKQMLQDQLWCGFGERELSVAFESADFQCAQVEAAVDTMSVGSYEHLLAHLQALIKTAKDAHRTWNRWAPTAEKDNFNKRLKELELKLPRLVSRKVMFIESAQTKADGVHGPRQSASSAPVASIKLKATPLPKFTGNKRDFFRWKREWTALQSQGEPTGSTEVRKFQLLDSLDDKTVKDLRLSTYGDADDIFAVLENRYGNVAAITLEIVDELQSIPPVRGHQPKRIVELIHAVEKALYDLAELGNVDAMKNPLVTRSIESKLPESMKKDWLTYAADRDNAVTPYNRFDKLTMYLKNQESIYEQLEQLREEDPNRDRPKLQHKHARSKMTRSKEQSTCIVCGDPKHRKKLYFCRKFKTALKVAERKDAVRQLGSCSRCLEIHEEKFCPDTSYLCKNSCADQHHYLLCPLSESKSRITQAQKDRWYTVSQEEFLSKLPPDLAQQCREAFCNTASKTYSGVIEKGRGLLAEYGLKEFPVIMMILNVTANAGQSIGTLIDLASDTNYITHKAAKELNLKSEDVKLVVHGVGGMEVTAITKRYLLKIRVNTPKGTLKSHQLVCYGLDKIAEIHRHVPARKLQTIFPQVSLPEFVRPKEIQLLISHKEGQLVPQKIQTVGNLVLWDGPLGKTVGGSHPDLFEDATVAAHLSNTHFARSMRTAATKYYELAQVSPVQEAHSNTTISGKDFLKWWKWESIGAACEPKCGGCRCGNCQPGGKEITLAEERELEIVRNGLTYVTEADKHSSEPHWHSKYPWKENPASLPNNKKAVEATFLRMERQLSKEPDWKVTYKAQIHDMLERKAATKLTEEMLESWTGPVWYISHLIAPNPHSLSTPVRLVWNSSQRYRGLSLNDMLIKGPDVLNSIRAVLLRFRAGVHAALGDIRKMYNSVWLEDQEVHLHRFLWRDYEECTLEDYAVTRVNMGDKPAGCIAQVAMRETANLPQFSHLSAERRVVEEDAYVDDILTSHNDPEQLRTITSNVEKILKAGGFYMKPWIFSGQSRRDNAKGMNSEPIMVLPNQLTSEDDKALGLGYNVNEDNLHVMVSVNFSKRKRKMRLGKDLSKEDVRKYTPNPLTRRQLLSQIAGLYDPLGLVAPAKQKGAILVRRAFQEVKAHFGREDTWDIALSHELREDAIKLLMEYTDLGHIKFTRALTPPNRCGNPIGVTFSDGSDHAFGAVLYLRWESKEGVVVRLVEAKAKLTPLDHKGDAVKAEMCGAVFAARLKDYFQRHCRIVVDHWYHFIDSQTVLGAIQHESYGFKTFFANRVGEIQSSTNVDNWLWIPAHENVADKITRGASPKDLTEDSEWQVGPNFLNLPESKWPTMTAKDVAAKARENITKMQKKAFTTAVTRRQRASKESETKRKLGRPLAGGLVSKLVDVTCFSTLERLVKTIAWVWRAVIRFKGIKPQDKPKWEGHKPSIITAADREDAFKDLCFAAQKGVSFPETTTDRLVVFKDGASGLLVCGGRIQSFKEDGKSVPLLPYSAWVSTLLAREAHNEAHDGIAGTMLRMRRKAWVIRGRLIAQKVVDKCVICRKIKAKTCKQIMGNLPEERSSPASPFEFIGIDLFGPYQVKDDVKKRVSLKVWGVVFCCMWSRAIHVELANSLSTESFLLAYQRFTSVRGHPKKVWSDPGTNFIGAKPVLAELYNFLQKQDKEALVEMATVNGTSWSWNILPADSPHRNGAAEAAVRITKRALQSLGTGINLTYIEFDTALKVGANLANERPIDAQVQSREDRVEYISPNSLLLGRASQTGDIRTFDFEKYSYKRLREIQNQVNSFWKSWCQLAGPNLFIRSKWHTSERNVAVGDVVWLCDQNTLRGQFRLARVVAVNPDLKGVVRDVHVQVSHDTHPDSDANKPRQSTILHRDVRRLVVLLTIEEQNQEPKRPSCLLP